MKTFVTLMCVLSAIFGEAAIYMKMAPLQSTVFAVACIWFLSNILVSKAYRRSYWKDHNLTFSQFIDRVRGGGWPEKTALEKVTALGSFILMGASAALYFV
jgi:hypothetical protein